MSIFKAVMKNLLDTGYREKVEQERKDAYRKGQTHTEARPFHSNAERIGAMRCVRHSDRQSTHVRYLVGFSGRMAYCDECAQDIATNS